MSLLQTTTDSISILRSIGDNTFVTWWGNEHVTPANLKIMNAMRLMNCNAGAIAWGNPPDQPSTQYWIQSTLHPLANDNNE